MKLAFVVATLWILADPPRITNVAPSQARVELENAAVQNGMVTGTLHNETDTPVRSVTLLVQHHYRWANEFKPGNVDPGRAQSVRVSTDLPPGGRVTFQSPVDEPLAPGDGGHFEITVSVLAFEQVFPAAPPGP
ncbi:MAG TPA: hypothetical protein VMR86_08985 [Myxococcota bacterium]|nr:hypothetical protein [Myxococcota bacterium]